MKVFFDIKVIDTDASSHRNHSHKSVLVSGAKEKKRIYCDISRLASTKDILKKRLAAELAHKPIQLCYGTIFLCHYKGI